MKHELPPNTVIDVELRKEMSLERYYKLKPLYEGKGWKCQGYQKGFLKPIK